MRRIFVLPCVLFLLPGAVMGLDRIPATNSGMIGYGFDSVTGEVRGKCVTGLLTHSKQEAQETVLKVHHITDSSELRSVFSLRASASLGFGIYEGSASFAMSQSSVSSSYHDHLLVNIDVVNRSTLLDEPELAQQASVAFNAKKGFRERCGDYFIAGVITGGAFSATFSFESTTDKQQSETRSTLSATALRNKFDSEMESKLTSLAESSRLSVKVLRKGPSEEISDLKVADLIRYARSLPAKVVPGSNNEWDIYYIVKDYGTIVELPIGQDPEQDQWLDELGDHFERLASYRAGLLHMIESSEPSGISSEFGRFSLARAQAEANAVQSEMAEIRARARSCVNSKLNCERVALSSVRQTPRRRSEIKFDPKHSGWRTIVSATGDSVVLEGHGGWWPHYPPEAHRKLISWREGSEFRATNIQTGQVTTFRVARPFLLSGKHDIEYRIIDSDFTDNAAGPDGFGFSVYYPLFPEDFSPPPELSNW
jgi:hypothetical protein